MNDEEVLGAVWLVVAVGFLAMEIVVPGLFMLPFGVGAGAATVVAFAGVGFAGQLAVFLVASAVTFLALRPLARRLARSDTDQPVGATRLLRARGVVLEAIEGDQPGLVRVEREEWRAETPDGSGLAVGTHIEVAEVRGARLVVTAVATSPAPPIDGGADDQEEIR